MVSGHARGKNYVSLVGWIEVVLLLHQEKVFEIDGNIVK